ncbi:MAG: lipid hydroperoxide peroxidase [Ilumatobacter coccineus]|uniref:Thiol peroxidase n=1 Tax=Ilumatobacter coccineus TaxID=467094 RepID=A0A2G6KDN6_9ACTN|nr:MAG: lipid hydroperoxide peroxidase [Ilumatobacter coccineus]
MAQVTLRGNPFHTNGDLPSVGSKAPAYTVVGGDLSEITSDSLAGKKVILNIFPSIDTPTCAMSVRAFNAKASALDNTVVVCVSQDLPFAAKRFCGAEGLDDVLTGSGFRGSFADDYGIRLQDGPLAGLMARCVVVVDESGTVTYTQLVSEIGDEPDYEGALAAVS